MRTPTRRTWAAAVCVVAGVLLVAIVVPAACRAREEYRRIRDRNNLNQIAKGLGTYLTRYGDGRFYPPDLGLLFDTGIITDRSVFVSPCDSDPPELPSGLRCSYVYTPEARRFLASPAPPRSDGFPPNIPFIEARQPCGDGRTVLFADSHVEFRAATEEQLPAEQGKGRGGERRAPSTRP